MATTIDTDTELSAVNSILGAIGQSPVTTLNFTNPEVSFIYNLLTEVNKDVQNEGWNFNREQHVEIKPDSVTKKIAIPADVLSYDLHDNLVHGTKNLVERKGFIYDKENHTDEFEQSLYMDIVYLWEFEDLPNPVQRYITYRTATRAATQLVSNPQLVRLIEQQEAKARATCLEYECNQGDHSFFGLDHGTVHRGYQPYHALQR